MSTAVPPQQPSQFTAAGDNIPEETWRQRALDAISIERHRQVVYEGFKETRDVHLYKDGALAIAGACYAQSAAYWARYNAPMPMPSDWPWAPSWWKPKNALRDLERAGALLVAEMERVQYMKSLTG